MNDSAAAVEVAPAGDERADFDALYADWYRAIVRLCRRTLGRQADAESMAQEVFVRAWASWDRYDPARPFGPWISTIARRLCINELIAGDRREALAAQAGESSVASIGPSGEHTERVAQADVVARVFGRIPTRHRRLLFLSDMEGWSTDEIARFEGVTPTAVRVSLSRARRSFRRLWERDVQTGAAAAFGLVHRLRRWLELAAVRRQEWAVGVVALFAAGSAVGAPTAAVPVRSGADVPVGAAARSSAPMVDAVPQVSSAAPIDRAGTAATASPALVADDVVDPIVGSEYSFTPSPAYEEDHTVFAAGWRRCDLGEVTCPVLLKSTDGGRSWSRLAADGYQGGRVLLAPTYPHDPRLFARGTDGLSVSHDGGRSFELRVALPAAGHEEDVVVSPRWSEGDTRILLGARVLLDSAVGGLEYRDADGSLAPIDLPLPDGATPVRFAVSPRYAEDRTMLVSVLEAPGASIVDSATVRSLRPVAAVYRCTDAECEPALRVAYGKSVPTVRWSNGPRPVAIAQVGSDLYHSRDGGRTFQVTEAPPKGNIRTITSDRDGRLYLGLFDVQAGAVLVSDDDGATWRTVWREAGRLGVSDMLVLDGTILGSRSPTDGGGIVRSGDGGRTWTA